jgi:hypothetical protein
MTGMTVGELYEYLGKLFEEDPDHRGKRIVMSGDAEGNKFSPLNADDGEGITFQAYYRDNAWSGEIGDPEEAPDDAEIALVLWPMN